MVFALRLRRRLRTDTQTFVIRTHVRLLVAAIVAAIPAEVFLLVLRNVAGTGTTGSLAAVAVVMPVALGVFYAIIRQMRVGELDQLLSMLRLRRHQA